MYFRANVPWPRITNPLPALKFLGIPPAPRGVPQIEVTFELDANGIVNVSAKDLGSGKVQSIRVTSQSGLTQDEIDRILNEAENQRDEDDQRRELAGLINRAETLLYTTKQSLEAYGEKLESEDIQLIEHDMTELRTALDQNNLDGLEELFKALEVSAIGSRKRSTAPLRAKADGTRLLRCLRLPPTADEKAIKAAYKRLAHQYHPDKTQGDPKKTERFRLISEAYNTLSDASRRSQYDARRRPNRMRDDRVLQALADKLLKKAEGLSDKLGDFFRKKDTAGDAPEAPTRKKSSRSTKALDINHHLEIDFETAMQGGPWVLEVLRPFTCGTCKGGGVKPGSEPALCPNCAGSGEINVQQDFFRSRKPAVSVRDVGHFSPRPRHACSGRGIIDKLKKLKIKIPPGADTGTVLRYRGEGARSNDGAKSGDLRVIIRQINHGIFERDGDDLVLKVPISFTEAALGTVLEIPGLDGPMTISVKPGTQSGEAEVFKGKGAPRIADGGRGDQKIEFIVETPRNLSKDQRNQLETLSRIDEDEEVYPQRAAFAKKLKEAAEKAAKEP